MPCQNRWLGSISAPTWVASISSARRCIVDGLKTMLPGCISMATLTSASAARAWISFQNGTATSHWWSRTSSSGLHHGSGFHTGLVAARAARRACRTS